MAAARTQTGKIVQLNKTGVGYLVSADTHDQMYVFTFDKIRRKTADGVLSPYRGESAAMMGLREGLKVEFQEENGVVDSLEI